MAINTITTEEYCSLSPQDRAFYLEHKDDTEMYVYNGKLYLKVRSKPRVTWERFRELLHLPEHLTSKEQEALHIATDFGDWNKYGRPYLDHGFYYWLYVECSAYGLKQIGVDKPAKDYLAEWLAAHGFTPDEIATISYSGGIGGYTKAEGFYQYKDYALEVQCRFRDIPPHYLPTKIFQWLKRNPQWKHKILKPDHMPTTPNLL